MYVWALAAHRKEPGVTILVAWNSKPVEEDCLLPTDCLHTEPTLGQHSCTCGDVTANSNPNKAVEEQINNCNSTRTDAYTQKCPLIKAKIINMRMQPSTS